MNTQPKWPARFLNRCIRRYQLNGGSRRYFGIECNFEPTCSEYTRQAIEHEGALKGLLTGMQRIKRCNHPDLHKPIKDPYIAGTQTADNSETRQSTTGNHSHV